MTILDELRRRDPESRVIEVTSQEYAAVHRLLGTALPGSYRSRHACAGLAGTQDIMLYNRPLVIRRETRRRAINKI